jgi:hypothetical protein
MIRRIAAVVAKNAARVNPVAAGSAHAFGRQLNATGSVSI